jgi:vacuolar protein sorting-associated protein 54
VYFEQDFHLENPRTFDIVSERSEIVRPPGPNGSASGPGSSGKKALATNAILQEKLSWYMDTVEIHLISSISTASTSFFAALGSLRELHSDAADSATKIKTLREDLSKLDEDMAAGGLRIMALKRRRENMRKLGDAVHQLKEIIDTVRQCEEQVDRGDIEIALKGLTNVERLMAGDPEDLEATAMGRKPLDHRGELIDLRGLKALDGAGNDIAFLRKKIGKAFEAKFMDTLMGDLKRHIDAVSSNSTFQRFDTASNRLRGNYVQTPTEFPAYLHVDGAFRGALLAQLKGLARSDSIMPAAMTYREAILKEFKNLIRRHLPSSSDEDAESTTSIATHESRHFSQQERSSILARNLRALDPDDAEEMFKKIYANVGEALRRLGTQVKVLLDITSSLGSPHPVLPIRSPRTPFILSMNGYMNAEPSPGPPPALVRQEEIQQALDLSSLLGQAVDIAQVQINKILRVRSEQTTHLDVNHFLRYFTLNRLFADECEAVSGRGGSALKTVVNDHIKAFVNYLGETERRRLLQGMDVDRWDAKDFTEADAKRLSMIIDASTTEVAAWTKATVIWDDGTAKPSSAQPNGISNGSKPTSGVTVNTSESSRSIQPANSDSLPTQSDCLPAKDDALPTKEKIRSAVIDEQKFILPESAMTVASGIEVFEQLLTGIPSMSQEIAGSLLEYLKLFNSRSSQLILGAGATLSAGLKNITTKHLALSSQALSFVIALIPHIREFVRRYSPNSNLLAEFDRVKRLFQEHQSGIHDKLVDIMSGRAAAHVSAMKKIDWDATSTTNAGVNTYMETLIRETTTLHKVLSKHLPEATVQTIMLPVMANYRERWGRAFGELVLKTLDGKQRSRRYSWNSWKHADIS